jgi:lysophospholipase L1-like esterase
MPTQYFHQRRFIQTTFAVAGLMLTLLTAARAGDIAVKDGQKVAFLGDSITAFGTATPSGYVRLVESGLAADGIKIQVIPAGVSGNTSKDEQARLDRDVIDKKPDWVTISCGVNDVWHGAKGVPLDGYKEKMTDIVTRCKAAGIKVMLLTSTPIGEDISVANNQKLIPYNDFLRELAKDQDCLLADLNADMQAELKKRAEGPHPAGNLLTVDGVHMNPLGNRVMATGILRAFGADDAQINQAQAGWLDIPGACPIQTNTAITLRQYVQLDALAASKGKSVADIVRDYLAKALSDASNESPAHLPTTTP